MDSSAYSDVEDASTTEGCSKPEQSNTSANAAVSPAAPNKVEMRSQFSHAKILHIIKSAHDFNGATQDAVFLLARATELFLEKMARDLKAANPNADKLTYDMLSKMAHGRREYAFLAKQGILPLRMRYADAIDRHNHIQMQRRIIDDPFYGLQIETPLRNQAKYAAECVRQQNLPQILKALYSPPSKVSSGAAATGATPTSATSSGGKVQGKSPSNTPGSGGSGKKGKKLDMDASGSSDSKYPAASKSIPNVSPPSSRAIPAASTSHSNEDIIDINSDDDDCMIVT